MKRTMKSYVTATILLFWSILLLGQNPDALFTSANEHYANARYSEAIDDLLAALDDDADEQIEPQADPVSPVPASDAIDPDIDAEIDALLAGLDDEGDEDNKTPREKKDD